MKYDEEYNSYKFSREELYLIIHSLISYSNDPFVDKITQKNVEVLLDNLNKSIRFAACQ